MARMTGFIFQDKYLDRLAKLSDQEVGRLVRALATYHATGEEQELKGRECGYYDFIKGDIDENEQAYQRKCNNMKREQLTAIDRNCPQLPATADNINNNNKDNIKENTNLTVSIKEKRTRFSPPTVEEVEAYCKERGNNVSAQRFVDFYASKGWKVGQNPMKDWKACVRTWEQRDSGQPVQKPKVLRAQDYEQREYREEEMREILGVHDLFREDTA
jgi:hypothetical protein